MGNRYQDRHQYFDELVETSTAFYVEYICRFMPIAEGTRILEVGCGEGGNLLPFALIGCEVTGVDFSAKKIENARNYFRINGADGAFFCADFFDFPLQDKAFDAVLDRTLWLVNPHYKAKFGLHPVKLKLGMDRIPYLRNWFSTSCWYVVTF